MSVAQSMTCVKMLMGGLKTCNGMLIMSKQTRPKPTTSQYKRQVLFGEMAPFCRSRMQQWGWTCDWTLVMASSSCMESWLPTALRKLCKLASGCMCKSTRVSGVGQCRNISCLHVPFSSSTSLFFSPMVAQLLVEV